MVGEETISEEQNGFERYSYLQKMFGELPAAKQVRDIEALLLWRLPMGKATGYLRPSRVDRWTAYIQTSVELVGTLWN